MGDEYIPAQWWVADDADPALAHRLDYKRVTYALCGHEFTRVLTEGEHPSPPERTCAGCRQQLKAGHPGAGPGRSRVSVLPEKAAPKKAAVARSAASRPAPIPPPRPLSGQPHHSSRARTAGSGRGVARNITPPPPLTQTRRRIEKISMQIDDAERRLGELNRVITLSPGPHSVFVARTKHELVRDLTSARNRLLKIQTRARDINTELRREIDRPRRLEGRVSRITVKPSSAPRSSPGRALLPQQRVPQATRGPDSPNYYEDPVNSK